MKELYSYPKQINKNKITVTDNQCFFAMPFSEEYTNLYDTLVLYMEKSGFKCVRVDNNNLASVPIIHLILSDIAASQYIIVDISEKNANVFYELGITHTLKNFENVFIIKEEKSSTPFDIQHLQYISYNKNNLKALANELVKRLNANQYKNFFKKALLIKQFVDHDTIDDFVNYFSKLFSKELITNYTYLLSNTKINIGSGNNEYEKSIWEFDKVLQEELYKNENESYVPILFRVYFELLSSCCQNDVIQKYIDDFLNLEQYGCLEKEFLLPYQTDLAIMLAEKSKLLGISLKWIIAYFQRSKSTKVDLNRYKLEAFLLRSSSEKVNEYIINALLSENNYIREHLSDIVGEKKLFIAEDNLITQLKREPNIYTVCSIVEALGKINSQKAITVIQEWLDDNADIVIKNKNYFVLKHFRNALIRLGNDTILKEFNDKYYDILKKTNTI